MTGDGISGVAMYLILILGFIEHSFEVGDGTFNEKIELEGSGDGYNSRKHGPSNFFKLQIMIIPNWQN